MSERKNNLELLNRRRSSSKSVSTASSNPARVSVSSSGNTSPINTIAGRSSTQSVIVVRAPSFLTPTNVRKISKSGSEKSEHSDKSLKSEKSVKSDKSRQSNKRRGLTTSFLRRKRVEYAGIFIVFFLKAKNFDIIVSTDFNRIFIFCDLFCEFHTFI